MHKFEYIQSTGSSLWHSGLRVWKMFIPPNLNGNQSLLLWNWHYCLSDAWACVAVTPQLFSPDNNTNSQRNAKKHAAWLSITSAHNSLASVFILTECTSASSNRSPEIWILDPGSWILNPAARVLSAAMLLFQALMPHILGQAEVKILGYWRKPIWLFYKQLQIDTFYVFSSVNRSLLHKHLVS